jgi:hypothetical protein
MMTSERWSFPPLVYSKPRRVLMVVKNSVPSPGSVDWKALNWPPVGEPFYAPVETLMRNPEQPEQAFKPGELRKLEGLLIKNLRGDEKVGLTQVHPVTMLERTKLKIPPCITHMIVGNEGFFRVVKQQKLDVIPVRVVKYECPCAKEKEDLAPPETIAPIPPPPPEPPASMPEVEDEETEVLVEVEAERPPPSARPVGAPDPSKEWRTVTCYDAAAGRLVSRVVTPVEYLSLWHKRYLGFQWEGKEKPEWLPLPEDVCKEFGIE